MIKIFRILLLFFTCIFILSPSLIYSQSKETGAIQGIVSGEDSYLPGVKVTISSPRLIGGEQSTVTNADGKYRFPALPPGTYTLLAQLEGFTSARKTGVRLKIGITLTVDLTMELVELLKLLK